MPPTRPNAHSPLPSGPRATALDHRALFAVGLERVRTIAGKVWTDHNPHDPGITMLELLCYAITDLSYRASQPIPDLLTLAPGTPTPPRPHFHTAGRILPTRPRTAADYRRLLIDLDGVRNAWLRPARQSLWADTVEGRLMREHSGEAGVIEVPLAGLFDVWLELDEGADEASTVAAARRQLHRHRNLGDDFERIGRIGEQRFNLCAELELEPTADTEKVHAEVLFAVAEHLSPRVPRHGLEALLERGVPADRIFDGPMLAGGFILAEDLTRADLPENVRLSDVIRVVMNVPGVVAITDIVLMPSGATTPPADRWVLPMPEGHSARLELSASRLVSKKRGMLVPADPARVMARVQARAAAAARDLPSTMHDLPVPSGRFRDPGRHQSVQNDFPKVYGLGPDGLPSGATPARQVQVRQLQGFLLFFDQLLADYLAQLANVADLLSTGGPEATTRFHQVVDSFRDARATYSDDAQLDVQDLLDRLDPMPEQLAQRNDLLDHLLARFAEGFADYAAILHSTIGITAQDTVDMKRAFLDDYPEQSAARGLGPDLGETDPSRLWDTDNVSGLERRVARLLGMPNPNRRNLADIRYDLYPEIDLMPDDEYRFRVRRGEQGRILLSSSKNYVTREAAGAEMRTSIRLAQSPAHYNRLRTSDGRFYFNIVDATGEVTARRIEYFQTEELREAAIGDLIRHLRGAYSEEGCYVIENILLRPRLAGDPLLPICADPRDPAAIDPYSYRVHVVLPAFGHRFEQMPFRDYVEQTIRDECPAHVLPKICWLDHADMARVEKAYRDWVFLVTGVEPGEREQKLTALFTALANAKNTYPRANLSDCGSDRPPFVLDRTALGTLDDTQDSP